MNETRVVNTSPLIYLSRSGLLDLLKAGAEQVLVPQPVADEILAWPTADAAQAALKSEAWLSVVPGEAVPEKVMAWDLGAGESSVLAHGVVHPGVTLVIDDLAARRCANAMGLPLRGTLGLVLRAKKQGTLSSVRETLAKLKDAGMFLSDALLRQILSDVGER